jgi:prepilin-type N-terminal cleavage/methylation domain-containing protein
MHVKSKRNVQAQQGFTLIEIIAVLVILGILSAVAVPRYFDLQEEATLKARDGACAAASSNINMAFSKALLNGNSTSAALTYATDTGNTRVTDLGDWTIASISSAVGDTDIEVELSSPSDVSLAASESNCTLPNPAYDGT